ncbi:universal stress protein [Desulfotomaculum copahuensis]|nr:universal stress protein [Desulfotomaculum copahuensis]
MKILVPVDGSASSMRAAEHVLQMARNHPEAEVTLLAVACSFDAIYFAGEMISETWLSEECRKRFAQKLNQAAKIFSDAGLPVKTVLLTGNPGSEIVKYIQDEGMDEVVMGSRGHNPLAAMALGSVTYKVLHHVKIPVTVIK